jgi:uncharacterized membrane protein YdbT with pleckstrin-like domain
MMQRLDQIQAFRNDCIEEEEMSSQFYNTFNDPAQYPLSQAKSSPLRGVLVGMIPFVLLLIIVTVTVLLTALVRQLVASSGFFAQQQAALIVVIIGLGVALVSYLIAIVVMLRRVTAWQRGGAMGQARAALLALGFTALVVLLPVVLAIVLPQSPAP